MKRVRIGRMCLLSIAFSWAFVSLAMAGAASKAGVKEYEGQIKSIKVDKCGLQPGSCEGSVILAKKAGGEQVTLAIMPGTWLKRGDQLVTIDELGVGNYVKVEAVQLPGDKQERITILRDSAKDSD
jgi:hypothetical protein